MTEPVFAESRKTSCQGREVDAWQMIDVCARAAAEMSESSPWTNASIVGAENVWDLGFDNQRTVLSALKIC
jgi:hypothetical protein